MTHYLTEDEIKELFVKALGELLSDRIAAVKANDNHMEEFITELRKLDGAVTEFDENLWSSLVDYVTVMANKTVVFTSKGGTEITV